MVCAALEQSIDAQVRERTHDILVWHVQEASLLECTQTSEDRGKPEGALAKRRDPGLRMVSLEGGDCFCDLRALGSLRFAKQSA